MKMNVVAALWGLAEATAFFVVPDVFLSALGLRNLRAAMAACLFALGGALVGGALMYEWASRDAPDALALVETVPAISPEMLERVRQDLVDEGLLAILIGPLYGTPYKTFAVHAAAVGIGLAHVGHCAVSWPCSLWDGSSSIVSTSLLYQIRTIPPS